jgi:hypothetical protein
MTFGRVLVKKDLKTMKRKCKVYNDVVEVYSIGDEFEEALERGQATTNPKTGTLVKLTRKTTCILKPHYRHLVRH